MPENPAPVNGPDAVQMPVYLTDYDANWPAGFEQEKRLLIKLIGPWLHGGIEHVGSTAVAGLKAKPVIDMMAGVRSLPASRPAVAVLVRHGYCYFPYKEEVMHWLCKPSDAFRTHHLHLIPYGSALWKERVLFRDILLRDPDIRQRYQALKLELAASWSGDREMYTRKKEPFIREVLARFMQAG